MTGEGQEKIELNQSIVSCLCFYVLCGVKLFAWYPVYSSD